MSGGGGSGSSTTTNKLDPQVAGWTQNNYNVAQGVANQQYSPYTGQMIAPINTIQTLGAQLGINNGLANTGATALNQGQTLAGQAGSYTPQTVGTGQWNGSAASQYMTPYTQSVI